MSKICENCGTELEDNATTCTSCGAQAPADAPAASKPAASKRKKSAVNDLIKKVKKNPKLLIIPAAAIVVILAVVIALLWNPIFNPWRSGMDNFHKLVVQGKSSAVSKAAPKEVWDYIEDQVGISQADFKKDAKRYAEDVSEDTKETFGDNVKMTYKVVKSKKMTKAMVEAYGEGLENTYDIDKDTVKAGYVVQYKYEVSGKNSFEWGESFAYIVQIKSGLFSSGWYVVSEVDVNNEEPICFIYSVKALQDTDTYIKKSAY